MDFFGFCHNLRGLCDKLAQTRRHKRQQGIYRCVCGDDGGELCTLVFQAIKVIELGTAYAVWSGLGLTITALIGFVVFKEQVSVAKILCLCLIIIGVVGLRYLSAKVA